MSRKNLWELRKGGLLLIVVSWTMVALLGWTDKKPLLKNGIWKAELQRTDGRNIVFNFETRDSAGKKVLYVINGEERLLVDSISVLTDSVLIHMPFFDSHFRAKLDGQGNLEGVWIKRAGEKQQTMPFKARYNQKLRFAAKAKPKYNVTGRWSVQFTGNGKTREAVGEFQQEGTRLTGTFLTASGDYRYLEGVVSGDSLQLSAFDGSHAFLFTAKLANEGTLQAGRFYSGATGEEQWTARKDEDVALPDGYDQSHMRPGASRLNFRFKGIDGKEVSLNDETYKNKVVVLQIMGSWCPNCMDETRFLSEYYNRNRDKGVEVLALAYERTTDFETSKASLQRFQKRFNVQYPVLVTGVTVSDPFRVEKTLPQLDRIAAFPTTIFIDKKGVVRKIHSGFNGPGTGAHYEHFQQEFNETIDTLLKEL